MLKCKHAMAVSARAAHKRRFAASAGLLRIDGEVVVAVEKAAEFRIPANKLRVAVSHGINTTPLIRAWLNTSGGHPHEWAARNLGVLA